MPAVVWRSFERAVDALATACIVGMFLAAGAQVLFRYALELSVPWTEELARLLFVLAMLAGIGIAIRQRDHIVVDFLLNKVPPRGRRMIVAAYNVAILFFLLVLAIGAAIMARTTWDAYFVTLPFVRAGYLYVAQFAATLTYIVYVARIAGEALRGGSGTLGKDTAV
jgi:TRAP-type C4-dicarboxylate transport system permease small subunit